MKIEQFRDELAALVERARTDPKLNKQGRLVVINLIACAIIVGKSSGASAQNLIDVFGEALNQEFSS